MNIDERSIGNERNEAKVFTLDMMEESFCKYCLTYKVCTSTQHMSKCLNVMIDKIRGIRLLVSSTAVATCLVHIIPFPVSYFFPVSIFIL